MTNLNMHPIAFSDSSLALAQIRGETHRWKTFVENRVAEIQTLVSPDNWRHVVSEDNPADSASRGLPPGIYPQQVKLLPRANMPSSS